MLTTITMRSCSVAVKTNHLPAHQCCSERLAAIATSHPTTCTASTISADLRPGQAEPEWHMAALHCNTGGSHLDTDALQPATVVSQLIEVLEESGWRVTAVGRREGDATIWEMVK